MQQYQPQYRNSKTRNLIDYISHRKNKIGIILLLAFLTVTVVLLYKKYWKSDSDTTNKDGSKKFNYDDKKSEAENTIIALKLAGAKMYGSANCGNTIYQLELFRGMLNAGNTYGIYDQCSINVSDQPNSTCMDYYRKYYTYNGTTTIAYPSWEINGQHVQGVQSLGSLRHLASTSGMLLQAIPNNNMVCVTSVKA